jgi:hypothetical protein
VPPHAEGTVPPFENARSILVWCDCLWLSAADEGRHLVANQLAAATGENRRTGIKHARYYWLLLAESHLSRQLFAGMLRKIAALTSPAG